MPKLKALKNIMHNGTLYKRGAELTVTDKQAAQLIANRNAAVITEESEGKPADPKKK